MTVLTADFEKGTNGNTILTSDAGSASPWDSGTGLGGTGSLLQYSNTHVAHGSLGCHMKNATSGSTNLVWGTSFGTQTEAWGRMYIYRVGTASTPLILHSGGKTITMNATGTLTVSGGATTTNALPLNAWCRLEWHYLANTTSGTVDVKIFLTPDSTTPDETKTLFAGNTSASVTGLTIGNSGSGGAATEYYLDQIVGAATAYPGPFPVITTAPTVAGSTPVGSVLSCDGGTWGGTFTLTYQWQRAGVNISGATSSTYTTVTADIGNAITCVVTATGQQATNESASSTSSNSITVTAGGSPPVNNVAPVVSGTTVVGSLLSSTTGSWTDDGSPTFTYQWQRDVFGNGVYSNIASATSSTYTLVNADDGCHVRCVVTDSTPDGNTSANSNAVGLITEPAPVNTVAPVVSGTAKVGSALSTTNGTWNNMGGHTATFTYQWQRDNLGGGSYSNISGATASSYTLVDADDGCQVRCVVTATNDTSGVSANSNADAITEPAPTNSAVPVISGTAQVGQVMSSTTGTFTHMGGHNPSFGYQWQDSPDGSTGWANISGATASSYTVGPGEVSKFLRCVVTATNDGGNVSANSAASAQVIAGSTPPGPPEVGDSSTTVYNKLINLGYSAAEAARMRDQWGRE